MKQVKLILLLVIVSATGAWAQTAYNPFTQNIHFEPEPTAAGFGCGTTPNVEFTLGMTTADSAKDFQNNPLIVTVCIGGFEFDGTNPASVVTGDYASNFTWAFDPFAPNCIIGTQSAILPGTGGSIFATDSNASGDVNLALVVPTTSPIGTVLSVNVNLTVPAYMSTFNSTPDDPESTQTQTFCDLKIVGTVFHDTNRTNLLFDRTEGLGNPDNNILYANLTNSAGNVVKVVPVNADGTYEFTNVTGFQTYQVILSTTQGVVGNPGPAPALPPNWRNTGDDCCDGIGSDGNINGITTVQVSNASKENVDFGITQLIPTPVRMASFNVAEYNCNALISWSTASEENVSHFEILRRNNSNNSFVKIARVAAAGNSTTDKLYSYIDKTVEKSNNYQYRIKTVDIDASEAHSEIETIKLTCGGNEPTAQIFPNPVKNNMNLVYTTNENDIQLIVDIVDITGRKLLSKSQIVYKGTSVINMNVESLAVGQYMVRYHSVEGKTTATIKFTKD